MPKAGNATLNEASKAKNNEFYTQISDIERECGHYKRHFEDKIIFCNCDDPDISGFWRYFHINFALLGLRKLVSTHFVYANMFSPGDTYKMVYEGGYDADFTAGTKTALKNNGDFRSAECIEILKEADIVITNPPFSLFSEYVAQLVEYEKQFLIIGHQNAITYKDVFKLIKDTKIWFGYNNFDSSRFIMPDYYDSAKSKYAYEENGIKYGRVSGLRWYTNFDHNKRHESLMLYKKYTPAEYPKYDNFDAINIDKTADIPQDYSGVMGVPVTFFDKHSPEQFEIIGNLGCYAPDGYSLISALYLDKHKMYKRIAIRKSHEH
ncbi:adenine-specific methyltransferase EcoRI family protein [Treponema endosymbiont of Eucomonympha sp.]|uniref:adenine-specific methyltransferase EcoRI family protein n=1 Tax=Treponema endosymbiont of Eucomonympha sp. TaxID=1580831 RepID=UPI0007517CDC|nr:adenine-specific methyltransferase EcoRI family protein [Treponema endosymbiont of Eucomonympha sp.]